MKSPRPLPPTPRVSAGPETVALGLCVRGIPVVRELAEPGPAHSDRVPRMEAHPRREVVIPRPEESARGVLGASTPGGDPHAGGGVVLFPITVTAAPHLVN